MASYNWPAMGSGGGGGGVVTNAANVGTGVGLFQVLSGTVLDFRSITNGTGISWVQNVNDVQATISLAPFSTTNLSEGSNLYYTQARFDTAFAAKTTTNLTEGSNLYYTQARFDTAFSGKTTTDLAEGTNLYYTQARFDTAFAGKSTTDLAEGTNLYYTQARFDTAFAAKSTTDLAEGTNLYFTQARARLSISATAPVLYDNTTGVISMHVADATHDGYLSSTDWNTFSTASAIATPSQIGLVSIVQQSFGGLKKFQDGLSESGAVGFITANATLTDADNRTQTVSAAAGVTVTMPTTNIKAGEIWTFYNNSTNFLYLVASDASAIGAALVAGSVSPAKVEQSGKIKVVALIDTPVSNADWRVVEVTESGEVANFNASGDGYASTDLGRYSRINNIVELSARFNSPTIPTLTNAHINFEVPHPVTFGSTDASGVGYVEGSVNTSTAADAMLSVDVNSGRTMTSFFFNGGPNDVLVLRYEITYNLTGY